MVQINTDILIKILSGNANLAEKTLFEEWYKTSESNRAYFKEFRTIWENTGNSYRATKIDEHKAKHSIMQKIEARKTFRLRRTRSLVAIAASVALIITLTITARNFFDYRPIDQLVYTSGDTITRVILPDSTLVWLNKNSTIKAPSEFNKSQRKVLLEGQAYFEVKHDKDHPFKVEAANTIIKVLGTSFDINISKDNNVAVYVNDGRVAFYKSDQLFNRILLTRGMYAVSDDSKGHITSSMINDPNYLSWKTGTLIFQDTPLSEVCMILGKHFNKKLMTELKDTNLLLTGSFKNESLDDILKTLEVTFDISVKVTDESIYIIE